MSTKIYNGYRLSPAVDLFEFTGRLRTVMNPIRARLDAGALMDRAVTAIDAADARGEARPQHVLLAAMNEFDGEQRNLNPRHRGYDPNRFEVSFGYDQQTCRLLCLLYADQPEFTEAWESLPEVEEYGYWNNADQPEGVTDAGWDERRDAWERVMPGYTAPVECMLSFSLRAAPPYGSGMIGLVLPRSGAAAEAERKALLRSAARTKRARARSLAVTLLTREAVRRAEEAAGPDGGKPDTACILSRFLLIAPGDADNYEVVVDACEAVLHDITDFIVGDAEAQGGTHPLDLAAIGTAITRHLDEGSR